MVMFLVCWLTHQLCLLLGKLFKIWHIEEVVEKVADAYEAGDDFFYLIDRINKLQEEDDIGIREDIPEHLRFRNRLWNQLDRARIKNL